MYTSCDLSLFLVLMIIDTSDVRTDFSDLRCFTQKVVCLQP